jgi:hypothetical protein
MFARASAFAELERLIADSENLVEKLTKAIAEPDKNFSVGT